ncbi:hypothetical protein QA601_10205 [Chitinispirillales bacterium ANBcel5]|uniref:baeRF7 domain-containing protein n=1 Tax=Cellulosispirillum alkaliphilum TaxID=3039283 RepID=UPI002A526864|nr:hypothetical protein [Chitinispirillales bacterium ANBcel5]
MDIFTRDQLQELSSVKSNCVSIYMPTIKTGYDMQQNPTRFKNLVKQAELKLIERGFRSTEASDFLSDAKRLLNDGPFWQHMSDGLVYFASTEYSAVYRLPQPFPELSYVGKRFHLKPLITLLSGDTTFYLLILNIRGVRLYKCDRFSINRVESDLIPPGLDETLHFDTKEKDVQFSSKPSISRGNNPITIFGYGRQTDKRKVNILNYFHRVNDAIRAILKNSKSPLITAGVEYQNPIYREANTYPYLMEECIQNGSENVSEEELHSLAWKIVVPHLQETERKALDFFKQLEGEHSPMVVEDLETIVNGSSHGRVETLFILDSGTHAWGKIKDQPLDNVEVHERLEEGDEDLLQTAALNTMQKGGVVYVLKPEQIPAPSVAAAILRY